MAFGVVGMFDVALDIAVRSMWDELESRFGLGGVRAVPWPHVSFVVAGGWDRDAVERAISTNLPSMSATPVHLEPWVLFTGTSLMHPAIVRAAVRSRSIDRLHGAISEVVRSFRIRARSLRRTDGTRTSPSPPEISPRSRRATSWRGLPKRTFRPGSAPSRCLPASRPTSTSIESSQSTNYAPSGVLKMPL